MGLNKTDYIRVHGEEAWEIERQKRNAYKKQYAIDNKEALKERRKQQYAKHRDKILENKRLYYQDNKDRILEREAKRYSEKKDEILSKQRINYANKREIKLQLKKIYAASHKEEKSEYNRNYRNTKEGKSVALYNSYKTQDKYANRNGYNLTQKWILENIFNSSCIYCGDSNWKHLGCDRIDNEIAHTMENCVCSCGVCNVERQCRKMSVEEFIEYRKTHPRILKREKLEKVVEINGKKVIKKVG